MQHYISVVERVDPVALDDARRLFEEYQRLLGEQMCSYTLPGEIASLPAPYERPTGVLLLARDESGEALGCVGVRQYMPQTCEIKRLFVRPDARGHGLGRALMRAALDHARVIGYIEARVTTLPDSMVAALRLYRALGFREAEPPEDFDRTQDVPTLAFMSRRL